MKKIIKTKKERKKKSVAAGEKGDTPFDPIFFLTSESGFFAMSQTNERTCRLYDQVGENPAHESHLIFQLTIGE